MEMEKSRFTDYLCRMRYQLDEYLLICNELAKFPYTSNIANDSNRAMDAFIYSKEWIDKYGEQDSEYFWVLGFPSVLEVLLALAERMAFNLSDDDGTWTVERIFIDIFLTNLDIRYTNDDFFEGDPIEIKDKLRATCRHWVAHEYKENGLGGLFPLKFPNEDQRNVEIWYQMMAYLDENWAN